MIYVSNSFSLSMLGMDENHAGMSISALPIDANQAKFLLKDSSYISTIGHVSTASIVENQLGLPMGVNRISFVLTVDDTLIVAQYMGHRLPEGATSLPEGATILYIMVQCMVE
jgi:hypothetical protein